MPQAACGKQRGTLTVTESEAMHSKCGAGALIVVAAVEAEVRVGARTCHCDTQHRAGPVLRKERVRRLQNPSFPTRHGLRNEFEPTHLKHGWQISPPLEPDGDAFAGSAHDSAPSTVQQDPER